MPHRYFVLIALTARLHLVADINVGAATSEPLLQKNLVVAHFKLVRGEPQLVILEVGLFSGVGVSLALTVGTFWAA